MTRWTVAQLDELILNARTFKRPRAYVAALEAQRERLLAAQKLAEKMVAMPAEEKSPEPEPAKVKTRMAVPDLEPLADKAVDLDEMVADVLDWWRGHGLATLKRKAARGDIRALQLMSTISRQLAEMEKASREPCPRACCRNAASRASGPIAVDWPTEGEKC